MNSTAVEPTMIPGREDCDCGCCPYCDDCGFPCSKQPYVCSDCREDKP